MRTQDFGECLKELGFSDFVGVPCSYLAPLINWAINDERFIMANNEGEAVAIASGISLACGNSSLSSHFADLGIFGVSQTPNLASTTNIPKSHESTTEIPPIDKNYIEKPSNTNGRSILEIKLGLCEADNKDRTDSPSRQLAEALHDFSPKDKPKSQFGVVLMQNSGLSNALSPLTSLNYTFEIPILGFISLRGEPNERGENTDEPQHELLGKITEKLLKLCEIKCEFLSPDLQTATKQLCKAKKALKSGKSFFFIVRKACFDEVKLEKNPLKNINKPSQNLEKTKIIQSKNDDKPTRLQALQSIQKIALNAALLATTGKTGRELYELKDKENQLYMVGSMGCVSALGLGVALKSHKKIIAIDGDSALLMRLGVLSNNAYYAKCDNKGNFCHILLDNESHDSTGGQFNLSPFVDFAALAWHCGYENVIKAQNLSEFERALNAFMKAQNGGAFFIYLKIAKGSKKDLGRPKITPKQVARRFSAWLVE